MQIRSGTALLLSFVLAAAPAPAMADEVLERTSTFVTDSSNEVTYGNYVSFEDSFIEDGWEYVRTGISYDIDGVRYLDTVSVEVESVGTLEASITRDGVEYDLSSQSVREDVVREAHEQEVREDVRYTSRITEKDVPPSVTVRTKDEVSGREREVECILESVEEISSTQRKRAVTDTNTIRITFHGYGADFYEWNGISIENTDPDPGLDGYKDQILAANGYSPDCTVTSIEWSGDPYESGQTVCRDAVAVVSVPSVITETDYVYEAHYRGTMITDEDKRTVNVGTYTAPDPEGRAEYTVTATAYYERSRAVMTAGRAVLIGAGVLILVAAVVWLLMFLAKKKKREDAMVTHEEKNDAKF